MKEIMISIFFTIGGIALLFIWLNFLKYIYNYEIGKEGIEVKLFKFITVKCINYRNIINIEKASFKNILPFLSLEMFFALRLGNKMRGPYVIVRQRKGFFKAYILTPENADHFIFEVENHLRKTE